jgi:hypothetical protein
VRTFAAHTVTLKPDTLRLRWLSMPTTTCFISYSWDDADHKDWVLKLAIALQSAGVEVLLDQWEAHLGMDLTAFMEQAISRSQYVLLICTPLFCQEANNRRGGVGYEQLIVTGEILDGSPASQKKFVPILRRGEVNESLPSYLKSRLFLDFRHDDHFDDAVETLLRHIHAVPLRKKPPLGPAPKFVIAEVAAPVHRGPSRVDPQLFAKLQQFAFGSDGLDLSLDQAKVWAKNECPRGMILTLTA